MATGSVVPLPSASMDHLAEYHSSVYSANPTAPPVSVNYSLANQSGRSTAQQPSSHFSSHYYSLAEHSGHFAHYHPHYVDFGHAVTLSPPASTSSTNNCGSRFLGTGDSDPTLSGTAFSVGSSGHPHYKPYLMPAPYGSKVVQSSPPGHLTETAAPYSPQETGRSGSPESNCKHPHSARMSPEQGTAHCRIQLVLKVHTPVTVLAP